jgi:hypothetical protein
MSPEDLHGLIQPIETKRACAMLCVEQRVSLVHEFSSQVERHFSPGMYRSLFLERTGTAQFGTAHRTLLCIECPGSGPMTREGVLAAVARLTPAYGGRVDPCSGDFVLVSFSTPEAALRLTFALQRATARARLRMGLTTGRCNVVRGQADGQDFLVLLGRERARAEAFAARAAAGTVQMAPDTYDALGGAISEDMGSCVVMVEFENDALSEITLTVPPDGSAELSTFAGIGLT